MQWDVARIATGWLGRGRRAERLLPALGSQTPYPVENGQKRRGAASQKTGAQADDQRIIVLEDAVNDAENLENAKSAKRDQRNALVALFPPDGKGLWNKKQRVTNQAKSEKQGDELSHG
jgi:hypothetical protein